MEVLVTAYEELGRGDLARCVSEGWRYTYLNEVVGRRICLGWLNSLSTGFFGEKAEHFDTMSAWVEWTMKFFEGNEALERIISTYGRGEFMAGGKWAAE